MDGQIVEFQSSAGTSIPAAFNQDRRNQPGADEGRIAPEIGAGVAATRHLLEGELFGRVGFKAVGQPQQDARQRQSEPGRDRAGPQQSPVLLVIGR